MHTQAFGHVVALAPERRFDIEAATVRYSPIAYALTATVCLAQDLSFESSKQSTVPL